LLQLIGFFLGAAALLFPEAEMTTLTKSAVTIQPLRAETKNKRTANGNLLGTR
jgi:hypothetical protein